MSTTDLRDLVRRGDPATRRDFVAALARGLFGLACAGSVLASPPRPCSQRIVSAPRGRARQVIYLFLRGGMSHVDTLDPKPGKSTQGPVEVLRTRADGVLLGQYFPRLAEQM